MIKLGIFGDQTTSPELLTQLKTLAEAKIVSAYFSGNASAPEGFAEVSSPMDLLEVSDAILFLSDRPVSSELIRLVFRKSRHVYLKTIPNLSIHETKELINLEKEAGMVGFIFNPFNFVPHFDPFSNQIEKPVLINLRTCFEGTFKPSHEMLLLVMALNNMVQSSSKKVDIFGLNEAGERLVVNLRMEYNNGSVINLTFSQEKMSGCCEIFEPSRRTKFEFDEPLYVLNPHLNQEITSVSHFLSLINNGGRLTNSFYNLLHGVQIVNQVKEHLRFNEIDF